MLISTYVAPRRRGLVSVLVVALLAMSGCAAEMSTEGPLDPELAPVLGKADGWATVHNLDQVRTFAVAADGYSLLYGDDADGTEVMLAPSAPTHAWVWNGSLWSYQGTISEQTSLRVPSPAWIALYPPGAEIELWTAYLGRPQLQVDRVFSSVVDGATSTLAGATPGASVYALVSGPGVTELDAVQVSMASVSSSDGELLDSVPLDSELVELTGLVLEGEQRVVAIALPQDTPLGYADLDISAESFATASVPIEISAPETLELRAELGARIHDYVLELAPYQELTLIGGHNPLPAGAMIVDGLSGDLVRTVEGKQSYLFFAFEADALFEQPDALWFLIDADTGDVELLEGRGGWPVIEREAEPDPDTLEPINALLIDYGTRGVLYNQFFRAGPGGVLLSPKPLAPPDEKALKGQRNRGKPITGHADKCPSYRKIGIVIRLDDNSKPSMRREDGGRKAIPNFDEVVKKEFSLLLNMGFDEIHYIQPADLVSTSKSGTQELELGSVTFSVNKYGEKGLKPIITQIEAAIESIKDCCGEVVVMVNGHQTREGYLIFSHHYKKKKGRRTKRARARKKINASALAQRIAMVFADKNKTCIPTALVFHSCFSGKFDGTRYNNKTRGAINLHKRLVVLASSSHDEKSRGERPRDRTESFFFLEALDECMLIRNAAGHVTGVKTLKQAWPCIVATTKALAKAAAEEASKGRSKKLSLPQQPKRKQNPALD